MNMEMYERVAFDLVAGESTEIDALQKQKGVHASIKQHIPGGSQVLNVSHRDLWSDGKDWMRAIDIHRSLCYFNFILVRLIAFCHPMEM